MANGTQWLQKVKHKVINEQKKNIIQSQNSCTTERCFHSQQAYLQQNKRKQKKKKKKKRTPPPKNTQHFFLRSEVLNWRLLFISNYISVMISIFLVISWERCSPLLHFIHAWSWHGNFAVYHGVFSSQDYSVSTYHCWDDATSYFKFWGKWLFFFFHKSDFMLSFACQFAKIT